MKRLISARRALFLAAALFAGSVSAANAHIVLSQPRFEAGARYAAFFKVEHGCDGSPTVALRVAIPDGVTVLQVPEKSEWTVNAERTENRVASVAWGGRLEANRADQFGLFLLLPKEPGPLYFPAIQRCESGEMHWTDIPAPGQSWRDVPHPAPVLQLVAAAAGGSVTVGDIMIEAPWSRATPPGAPTGGAYLTIVNHGTIPDTLTGGSTPAAEEVQIHQMSMAGGIMSMRPVRSVGIGAGATVRMAPEGGYHLMLVGLKEPLKQGSTISITLNFARAGSLQVDFPVEAIGARGPQGSAAPAMDHDDHAHH